MSHTTLLSIDVKNGSCEEIKEYSNSHGAAPIIWGIFCREYLNKSEFYWLHDSEMKDLWQLYKRMDIPKNQRAVLMMTFDKVLITKQNLKRAADDINKFLIDFPVNPEYVNHWPEISSDILSLIDNPDISAIGFWHTSVSENPYTRFDEELDKEFLRDDLFDLYEELDKLK